MRAEPEVDLRAGAFVPFPSSLSRRRSIVESRFSIDATARSCFTVLQVTGQGLHPILAGVYHDRFEQVGGRWRFAERIFDPRLFGDLSRHMRQLDD